MPRSPSIEAISAVSSPHTNAPAPSSTRRCRLHAAAEDVVAEQACFCFDDRMANPFYRQRIFGANVEVALVRRPRARRTMPSSTRKDRIPESADP